MVDINITLFGQMITFIVFVVFTMKFVWPPLMRLMEDRREKIAEGLRLAEQGKKDYEAAQYKSEQLIAEAKAKAGSIVEQAHLRANHIIEEAKEKGRDEGDRMRAIAQQEIEQQYNQAKTELMHQVAQLAVTGAEKILRREVDKPSNQQLVKALIDEI